MNKIVLIIVTFSIGCIGNWQINEPADYKVVYDVLYNRAVVKVINNTFEKATCAGSLRGVTDDGNVLHSSHVEVVISPRKSANFTLTASDTTVNFKKVTHVIYCTPTN